MPGRSSRAALPAGSEPLLISFKSFTRVLFLAAGIVLSAGLSAGTVSGEARLIGQSEEVAGRVFARGLSGEKREIQGPGDPVYAGDGIQTSSNGFLVLRLLDETVFTVGPGSELVLDTFVYDPDSGEGILQASVWKGFFRFITGRIVKNRAENMTVQMAAGSIGVRGTRVAGEVKRKESWVVLERPENDAGSKSRVVVSESVDGRVFETHLTDFGFGTKVRKGKPPGPAFPVSPEDYSRLQSKLMPPLADDPDSNLSPFAVYDKVKQGVRSLGGRSAPDARDLTGGDTHPPKPPDKTSGDHDHSSYHSH